MQPYRPHDLARAAAAAGSVIGAQVVLDLEEGLVLAVSVALGVAPAGVLAVAWPARVLCHQLQAVAAAMHHRGIVGVNRRPVSLFRNIRPVIFTDIRPL